MALWSTTEHSVQRALHNWGVEVPAVHLVPAARGPVQDRAVAQDDDGAVILDAAMGRIPTSAQGAEVDSRGAQMRYPAEAAMLLTTVAPLVHSRWREGDLPHEPRLRRVLWELDQLRVDAAVGASDPSLRLMLHASATWMGRAPYVGGDDAIARQILTHLCPRADSLALPIAATDPVKEPLVDYLGPEGMREFIDLWRDVLACPDRHSLIIDLARRWLDALDRHLPDHANLTGQAQQLGRLAHDITNHLHDLEVTARHHVAELREEWAGHSPEALTASATDLRHGVSGAGTALPNDPSIYHRPASADDLQTRAELRVALAVARQRAVNLVDAPSRSPGGRADSRELVRWAAQRHQNRPVTATPWTRVVPELVEEPDITVAGVFDSSASMASWLRTASPLMWAVAGATHDLGGTAAVWGFGGGAFEVIRAGTAPTLVPAFHARTSGSSGYVAAIRSAVAATRLTERTGARLLIVLTDGKLPSVDEQHQLQSLITTLADRRVRVLWALTGDIGSAVVPDRATTVTDVTPSRFASVVRAALLEEVATVR